jgi:type IV secretory pathway TrbL component
VGRLLFSEVDPQVLWVKLQNLIFFRWAEDAFVLNMELDIQTWVTLVACFLVILVEIAFPKKMFKYKMLRQDGVLVIMLVLTLLYGSNGLGSAYGSR